VLQAGTGPGGAIPLVDGYRITLQIEGSTVGGTSACNSYGGTIDFAGNAVRITNVGGTEMACEPAVMESEAAFTGALITVTRWARQGDILTLGGPNTELTFALLAPVPAADIVDTVWVLDTLIAGDAASSVEERATLELRSDGSLAGSTGCRDMTGRYILTGDEVQVTELEMLGECPAALQAQDGHVVTVLGDGFVAEVEGNRLTLSSSGNDGLSYVAETE
jgi:heat shock protein HslJ